MVITSPFHTLSTFSVISAARLFTIFDGIVSSQKHMSHTLTVISFSKKKKKVSRTIVQTGGGLFGRNTDWTVFKGLYLLTAQLSVFSSFLCLF